MSPETEPKAAPVDPPCQDPGCGRWVRVATPMNLALAGWVLQQMPPDSMWVTGPAGNPALLADHVNIHVPHDWQLPDEVADEDEGAGWVPAGGGHRPMMWIWPDQQPGRP